MSKLCIRILKNFILTWKKTLGELTKQLGASESTDKSYAQLTGDMNGSNSSFNQ